MKKMGFLFQLKIIRIFILINFKNKNKNVTLKTLSFYKAQNIQIIRLKIIKMSNKFVKNLITNRQANKY